MTVSLVTRNYRFYIYIFYLCLNGRPVWARGRCRISPPRFLAECCKRQLNQVSLALLYFRLSAFSDLYWVCLSVFSCTVLFASTSQVIGCEDRLRNDLYCVGWGVKLYSNQTKPDATPAWPGTLVSIGTRRLYNETTVHSSLRGEGDVTFCWFVAAFVIIRCFSVNRVLLF